MANSNSIYLVDGRRTPFLKARTGPGPFAASDMAVSASRALLKTFDLEPQMVDEVIVGSTMPSQDEANIGRVVALRLGCGEKTVAWTVQRNCASGMQALDSAFSSIALGRSDIVLACGVDTMSRAPLILKPEMARWMAEMMTKKTFGDKLKQMLRLKLNYLPPIIALLRGLTDPNVGLNMGQTAENIVNRFKFTRDELDAFSLRSHQKAHLASEQGVLAERIPVYDSAGKLYNIDDGVRGDSSLEKLAKLKPFFDKPFGTITPGNSSQITDGAAALLLASDEAVKRYNLPVLARLQPTQWVGNSPREMGLAPAFAIPKLLNQNNLAPENIDYWEINEAFAAQVMGVQEALRDKSYCQDYIGLDDSYADIPDDKLNIYGGAVALGHPVGASGARIVLTLANILRKKESRLGVASICIGGGQGGAVLVENTGGQVA